jgi:hypothetical protein
MKRKCAKTHAAQTQVVPCHIFPGSDGSDTGSTKPVCDINFRWFQIHGVGGIQGLKTGWGGTQNAVYLKIILSGSKIKSTSPPKYASDD